MPSIVSAPLSPLSHTHSYCLFYFYVKNLRTFHLGAEASLVASVRPIVECALKGSCVLHYYAPDVCFSAVNVCHYLVFWKRFQVLRFNLTLSDVVNV